MINDYECHEGYYYFSHHISDMMAIAKEIIRYPTVTPYPGMDYPGRLPTTKGNSDWDGGMTVLKGCQQLVDGYCGTVEPVTAKDVSCQQDPTSAYPTLDVAGCYPDIGTYLMGDPNCMVNFEPSTTHKRIAIACSIGVGSSVTAESMGKIGRKTCSIIKGLEDKGYQVKLDIYSAVKTSAGYERQLHRIEVKDYHDAMDGDLIEWLFTPIGFRWGVLALRDRYQMMGRSKAYRGRKGLPFEKKNHGYGRGSPLPLSQHTAKLTEAFGYYDLVIDSPLTSFEVQATLDKLDSFIVAE